MVTYAVIGIVFLAVVAFMCWGDDGPLWKNMGQGIAVFAGLAAIGGAIIWVSSYGT